MIRAAMRPELPTGTVTFLFTDVEGSTKLLHELGVEAYAEALAEHRRVIREACAAEGGVEVDTQGDAFFFAFASAPGALDAASSFSEKLASGPISVRVGLHTGTPLLADEGYVGDDVHFAARVASSGHGGQVVLSKATATVVDGELVDLGEHRLKDIPEAVSIFQLGEGSFPPLKTISNTNLPRPASSFVGRNAELEEVVSRLEAGARLVTLTGPGGTGKTRLALEAALTLVPEYKAGVFWVGLASLRDSTLVTETIAQTLGAKDGLASHIADRELLLLLDNFEQVIEAAAELGALLSACPNLTLLVTSRELLRISGEVEYAVPPLAEPEAVALFCERSQLEPSEETAVLCARLDSLPLAVELAAARTTALTPAQILERLSSRLDLLKGGRDADPRQQTLRATIEWSHELLSPAEQELFARLSIFQGGCALDAAEDVADAELDTLQSLVEKSLVRFTNERYWMLETIREYARDQLRASSSLSCDVAGRHARWYRDLSEEYEPELMGRQGARWIGRLETELANIRAAIEWGIANDPIVAFAIVVNTSYFLNQTGRTHEHARLLESTWLDDVPVELRKRGLKARVGAALEVNDVESMRIFSEQRLELARQTGDAVQESAALNMLATSAFLGGDFEAARRRYEEALEVARTTGDDEVVSGSLANFGKFERDNGNVARSRELLEESLAVSRAVANEIDVAWAVKELAQTAIAEGDVAGAKGYLEEGYEIAVPLGLSLLLGDLVLTVALLAARTERARDGAALFGAVDAHDERMGFEHTPELTWWWSLRDELVSALGEAEFEALAVEGRALELDSAVARACALLATAE